MTLWTGVLILALYCLVATDAKTCDVTCDGSGFMGILTEGQCLCSQNFDKSYKKGQKCSARFSLPKKYSVRLMFSDLRVHQSKYCIDKLVFHNVYNRKPADAIGFGNPICEKKQLKGGKSYPLQSHQVRVRFETNSGKKLPKQNKYNWRMCLAKSPNKNVKDATCGDTLKDFDKGYNMRNLSLSNSNSTVLTSVCCKTNGFWKKEFGRFQCMDDLNNDAANTAELSTTESCIYCTSTHTSAQIEADMAGSVTENKNKKIECSCSEVLGAKIGESCAGGLNCLDSKGLATCQSDVCTCPSGYVESIPDGDYCTTNSNIGESCANGENCVSGFNRSSCNSVSGLCECPSGYYEISDSEAALPYCTKDLAIGDDCLEDGLKCFDEYNRATCKDNKCGCFGSFSANSDDTKCVYKSALDGVCDYDDDCTDSRTECTSNTCSCTSAYKKKESDGSDVCSLHAKVDETCEKNYDCTTKVDNSKCASSGGTKKCACISDHYQPNANKDKCNAVCLLKNGDYIEKGNKACIMPFSSGNNACWICNCNNPTSAMSKTKAKKNSCKGQTSSCSYGPKRITGANKCGEA